MQTDHRRQQPATPPDVRVQEELGRQERPMSVSYGIVGAILLLGAIGFVLDRVLQTTPWLMLGGLFLGLGIGFYGLRKFIVSG